MIKQLIITADDYGMCESVNSAIEQCIAAGTVHSTCVMANMPECEPASQLRQRFPHLSVGIHWTLTDGYPVLDSSLIPSLTDVNGRFFPQSKFKKKWMLGQILKEDVQKELVAQYQRLRNIVAHIDYWNTHQNVHIWPRLFQFMTQLANELGINCMRCNVRNIQPLVGNSMQFYLRRPFFYLKGKQIACWSSWAASKGMAIPSGQIYLPGFPEGQTAIEKVIDRINWAKIHSPLELVIHPATTIEPELFGSLKESRIKEYKYFSQIAVTNRLQQLGVNLVGFDSLSSKEN